MSFTDTIVCDVDTCDLPGFKLYKSEENYQRRFLDGFRQIAQNPKDLSQRLPCVGYKFAKQIDRFSLSLMQLTPQVPNAEGACPGLEIEIRVGYDPIVASRPVAIVQFQPELLFELEGQTAGRGVYNFNSFLLELNGRLGNRVDIYARPIDSPTAPGSARPTAVQFGVMAEHGMLEPSLQVLRSPGVPAATTVVFCPLPTF